MSPSSVLSSNGNHQWRKLTSITHHGHDCTSRLERRDNTHLVPRRRASKNSDPPDTLTQHLVVHLIHLLPRKTPNITERAFPCRIPVGVRSEHRLALH